MNRKAPMSDEELSVNASSSAPVYFMVPPANQRDDEDLQGLRVPGEIRLRNGGRIKLY